MKMQRGGIDWFALFKGNFSNDKFQESGSELSRYSALTISSKASGVGRRFRKKRREISKKRRRVWPSLLSSKVADLWETLRPLQANCSCCSISKRNGFSRSSCAAATSSSESILLPSNAKHRTDTTGDTFKNTPVAFELLINRLLRLPKINQLQLVRYVRAEKEQYFELDEGTRLMASERHVTFVDPLPKRSAARTNECSATEEDIPPERSSVIKSRNCREKLEAVNADSYPKSSHQPILRSIFSRTSSHEEYCSSAKELSDAPSIVSSNDRSSGDEMDPTSEEPPRINVRSSRSFNSDTLEYSEDDLDSSDAEHDLRQRIFDHMASCAIDVLDSGTTHVPLPNPIVESTLESTSKNIALEKKANFKPSERCLKRKRHAKTPMNESLAQDHAVSSTETDTESSKSRITRPIGVRRSKMLGKQPSRKSVNPRAKNTSQAAEKTKSTRQIADNHIHVGSRLECGDTSIPLSAALRCDVSCKGIWGPRMNEGPLRNESENATVIPKDNDPETSNDVPLVAERVISDVRGSGKVPVSAPVGARTSFIEVDLDEASKDSTIPSLLTKNEASTHEPCHDDEEAIDLCNGLGIRREDLDTGEPRGPDFPSHVQDTLLTSDTDESEFSAAIQRDFAHLFHRRNRYINKMKCRRFVKSLKNVGVGLDFAIKTTDRQSSTAGLYCYIARETRSSASNTPSVSSTWNAGMNFQSSRFSMTDVATETSDLCPRTLIDATSQTFGKLFHDDEPIVQDRRSDAKALQHSSVVSKASGSSSRPKSRGETSPRSNPRSETSSEKISPITVTQSLVNPKRVKSDREPINSNAQLSESHLRTEKEKTLRPKAGGQFSAALEPLVGLSTLTMPAVTLVEKEIPKCSSSGISAQKSPSTETFTVIQNSAKETESFVEGRSSRNVQQSNCPICNASRTSVQRYSRPVCIVKGVSLMPKKNKNDPWNIVIDRAKNQPTTGWPYVTLRQKSYPPPISAIYCPPRLFVSPIQNPVLETTNNEFHSVKFQLIRIENDTARLTSRPGDGVVPTHAESNARARSMDTNAGSRQICGCPSPLTMDLPRNRSSRRRHRSQDIATASNRLLYIISEKAESMRQNSQNETATNVFTRDDEIAKNPTRVVKK